LGLYDETLVLAEVVEAGDPAPPAQLVAWGWPSENSDTRQRVLVLVSLAGVAGALEVVLVVRGIGWVVEVAEIVDCEVVVGGGLAVVVVGGGLTVVVVGGGLTVVVVGGSLTVVVVGVGLTVVVVTFGAVVVERIGGAGTMVVLGGPLEQTSRNWFRSVRTIETCFCWPVAYALMHFWHEVSANWNDTPDGHRLE
jgi:hypothetical protein